MRSKSRRPAREAALKALYQIEVGKASLENAAVDLRENANIDDDLLDYSEALLRGVWAKSEELKRLLAGILIDWDYDRLASVDRNLLRIGAYELMYVEDVPPVVTLNEAIELAKKYSTSESGKFINGILSKVWESSPKAGLMAADFSEEPPPVEETSEEGVAIETIDAESPEWNELSKTGAVRPAQQEGDM